jgi:membrane associated rhomboid family serine protease
VKTRFKNDMCAQEWPAGNYVVMLLATVTFAIQMTGDPRQEYLNGLILDHLSFSSVLGHMWLHMSMTHIVGNLITLWIFGRHVSMKIGNAKYFLAYMCLGFAAAAVHILCDGRPTIGASGAIMGVLGMHVVLCFRRFGILGPWLVLVWFLLNLAAGVIGGFPTTYMAHVGGFLAGVVLANVLILLNVAKCDDADQALVRILRPSLLETSTGKDT